MTGYHRRRAGGRADHVNGHQNNQHNNNDHRPNHQHNLTKLFVKGWTNSNAASNPDGGIHALHQFLEKRSSRKIQRAWQNHDTYTILVNPDDVGRFTHLNNFTFANAPITVEQQSLRPNGTRPNHPPNHPNQPSHSNHSNNNNANNHGQRKGRNNDTMQLENDTVGADEVEAALVTCIKRCYHPGSKFLNLQAISQASELMEIGLQAQPASKVWTAIFVCCETKVFETPLKRQQMVESLSLAQNGISSVKDCISAAGTFDHIKNLDLSGNMITDVGELRYWRNKFQNLEHLILSGNPVDEDPKQRAKEKMQQWYPKLKMYNKEPVQVAPEDQVLKPKPAMAAVELLPNDPHPEIPKGHDYGQPKEGKAGDQLMKEQMALRFSYETRLRMLKTEEVLAHNNYNYDAALHFFQDAMSKGQVQNDLLWSPPKA